MNNDDGPKPSADDALEPEHDELKVGKHNPLPEDYDTPAAPAPDTSKAIPRDHPLTDSGIDSDELYDEGLTSATDFDAEDESDEDKKRALYGG